MKPYVCNYRKRVCERLKNIILFSLMMLFITPSLLPHIPHSPCSTGGGIDHAWGIVFKSSSLAWGTDINTNAAINNSTGYPLYHRTWDCVGCGGWIPDPSWPFEDLLPMAISITATSTSGNVPLNVSFTADTTGGAPPYRYEWDFGDGRIESGNTKRIDHTFNEIGNFNVKITVYDAAGNKVTHMVQVFTADLNSLSIPPVQTILTQKDDEVSLLARGFLTNGNIVLPENVTWSSSDTNVVKMEGHKAVAVGEGIAVITATFGGYSARTKVMVQFEPVAIDVYPVLLFLEKDGSATHGGENGTSLYQVYSLHPDGSRRPLPDLDTLSLKLVEGGDVVELDGQTIHAVSPGMAEIEVESGGRTATILVAVTVPVPLNILPSSVRVKPLDSFLVEIDGGTPPFTSRDDKGNVIRKPEGTFWELTAPSETGEYSYSLQDSRGRQVTLNMTVLEPLGIQWESDGSVSRSARGTRNGYDPGRGPIELKATGGTPPFRWYATGGRLTNHDSDPDNTALQLFTPPDTSGVHTVTVADSGGQSGEFRLSTVLKLSTSPQQLYLSPGEERDISILGGLPPFTVKVDAGNATTPALQSGFSIFKYTAPPAAGEYMITVADSDGSQTWITASVTLPLTASPSKAYLNRNQNKIFQLAGGIGKAENIFITALKGDVDIHPDSDTLKFSYTAPGVTGRDIITITDQSGSQAKVEINVISDNFFITPLNATLLKNEKCVFKIVGGSGESAVWTVTQGDIEHNQGTDGKKYLNAEYTAPDILSKFPILARDRVLSSKRASANIHVISDRVLISPKQAWLKPGETINFRGFFGTEQYLYTWTSGRGEREGLADYTEYSALPLTYTAPLTPGIHRITLFDSAGNSAGAEVIVSGGAKRPKIVKTSIFEITHPMVYPSSETQPVGVGPVQKGDPTLEMAFDFPNYEDEEGNPVPMNYYVGASIPAHGFFGMFDSQGGIFDVSHGVVPCITREIDFVYFEGLTFDHCNRRAPLDVDMYILAIESVYDHRGNMQFHPADAPFEMWHFSFTFPACP
ncbi:MAG: PKD domain-containing protein [Desulfamplus sp.]|nr:PKD domain-containing protein [Desulfamplus sp.]